MGGLSWWHWLIVLAAFVLLFGAKKLPEAARGVGRSLRILKSEVSAMNADEADAETSGAETPTAAAAPAPAEEAPAQQVPAQQVPAQQIPVANVPAAPVLVATPTGR